MLLLRIKTLSRVTSSPEKRNSELNQTVIFTVWNNSPVKSKLMFALIHYKFVNCILEYLAA